MNCKLELSRLSQFFQSLRHFSNQAKERSMTHRCGIYLLNIQTVRTNMGLFRVFLSRNRSNNTLKQG